MKKKENNQKGLSRRDFIKGAAAGAVSVAAMGIMGACSTADTGASSSNTGTSPASTAAPKEISAAAASTAETTTTAVSDVPVVTAAAESTINVVPGTIDETYNVDVVIIGAGGSGVACALQVVENGLKAMVIDKQNGVGGATKGGIDAIFSFGDKYHEAAGLNTYTAAQLVHHEMSSSQFRADGSRWLQLVNESAGNIDWIEDNGGKIIPYDEMDLESFETASIFKIRSEIVHTPLIMAGGGNVGCVTPLSESAIAQGAEFLYDTEATSLIQQEDGTIGGLYATSKDGNIQVNAKAVVLATGGFSANTDLLNKAGWDVEQTIHCNMGYETGDGYIFATDAGGQDRIGEAAPMAQWVIEAFPGRIWNDPVTGDGGFTQMAKQVLVNQDAIRFVGEDVPLSNPIMQVLPTKNNQATYSIFNDAIYSEHFANVPDAQEQLENAVTENTGDSFYRCDTIEECAEKFGLDATLLKKTIDDYNAMCDTGDDSDFLKDPEFLQKIEGPYYIGQVKNGMQVFIGGLNTSAKYEVLDGAYKPIPGLYATGVDGCTLYRNVYTVAIGAGIFAHSIFSGRKAADAIAEYIG